MPYEPPVVTVVVVTWNGWHLLPACLDSIRQQTIGAERVRTVVVDNGSTDGTAAALRRDYPEVDVMVSERNLGFAGGAALGLDSATTAYVAILNNDAELAPDALEHLLAAMTGPRGERLAAVAAKVLLADRFEPAPSTASPAEVLTAADGTPLRPSPDGNVDVLNSTGNVVRVDGFGQDRDWLAVDTGARSSGPVFGFSGAAALLRADAVQEVGGIDADFFMYYEDTDLSWRLRLAGWEIDYAPAAVVRHQHSASSREGSMLFRFHDDRNRLLTLTKNASVPMLLRTVPRYPLTALSVVARSSHRWSEAVVRARVLGSYARLCPRTLRLRRAIGAMAAARGVRRRDVERLLVAVPARPTGGYRLR